MIAWLYCTEEGVDARQHHQRAMTGYVGQGKLCALGSTEQAPPQGCLLGVRHCSWVSTVADKYCLFNKPIAKPIANKPTAASAQSHLQ